MDYWLDGPNNGSDEDMTQDTPRGTGQDKAQGSGGTFGQDDGGLIDWGWPDQTPPIKAPREKTLGEWLYPNMKQSFLRDQPDEGGGCFGTGGRERTPDQPPYRNMKHWNSEGSGRVMELSAQSASEDTPQTQAEPQAQDWTPPNWTPLDVDMPPSRSLSLPTSDGGLAPRAWSNDEGGGGATDPANQDGGFDFGKFFGPAEAEAGQQKEYQYPVNGTEDEQVDHLARVLYQETAGMRPRGMYPTSGHNDRTEWDYQSFQDLQDARKQMAVVAMRNPKVGKLEGEPSDRLIWEECQAAAREGRAMAQDVPGNVSNYYMVQRGMEPKNQPRWSYDNTLAQEFGPFWSGPRGGIPEGDNAFIRIHKH